jgi:hypothetical protein
MKNIIREVEFMNIKKTSLFIGLVLLIIVSIPGKVTAAAGSNYYVAVTGSDSNSGTISSPWRNIQYAINKAVAGDTIIARSGTYHEKLEFSQKGDSTGATINLINYAGETPVISGQGFISSSLVAISDSQNIKISGFEISNFFARYPKGIQILNGSRNIEISNCKIHDISTTSPSNSTSNPLSVIGNTTTTMTNIVIKNNEVYNCATGWAEGVTVNGNVDGWSIINNKVYNIGNIGIDAAGHWETSCTDAVLNQARNGLISGNIVYGCISPNEGGAASGIYVDGGKNIIIKNNIVHSSQHGIEIGCERAVDYYNSDYKATAEGIIATDNIVYNNQKQGMGIGGYNGTITGKVINSKIINNTLYNNQTDVNDCYGDLEISYSDGAVVSNNIIYGSGNNKPVIYNNSVNPVTNLTMNNNVFYTNQGANTIFNWKSQDIIGFDLWKIETSLDSNSVFGNPQFISIINGGDFHLQGTSIAKDKGNSNLISTGAVDFDGKTRIVGTSVDVGAYEFQGITNSIIIDGKINDWVNIKPIALASGQSVLSLKVTSDSNYYYFCIEGIGMGPKYDLFINSDNDLTTGYQRIAWKNTGFDYLIENGSLYKYNGSGWSWSRLGNTGITLVKSSSVIEIRLAKSKINVDNTLTIGFLDMDSSWNKKSFLN